MHSHPYTSPAGTMKPRDPVPRCSLCTVHHRIFPIVHLHLQRLLCNHPSHRSYQRLCVEPDDLGSNLPPTPLRRAKWPRANPGLPACARGAPAGTPHASSLAWRLTRTRQPNGAGRVLCGGCKMCQQILCHQSAWLTLRSANTQYS